MLLIHYYYKSTQDRHGGALIALNLNLSPSSTDLYLLYEQRELLPKHVRIFMEYLLYWAKRNQQKF